MSNWDRRGKAFSAKDAAALLGREAGVEDLVLTSATPWKEQALGDDDPRLESIDDERQEFHQFVTALERDQAVKTIRFENQDFGGPSDGNREIGRSIRSHRRESDVHRLFGEVLPNHPALEDLSFYKCGIPPRHFNALIQALPSTASCISSLFVSYVQIGTDGVRAVAHLLRQNFPLEVLLVQGWTRRCREDSVAASDVSSLLHSREGEAAGEDDDDDDGNACRILCDAAASNQSMRRLLLGEMTIGRDATTQALGRTSTLRALYVRGAWTKARFVEALGQLRQNEVLETFHLIAPCDVPSVTNFPSDLLVELLSTYNCTLAEVPRYDLGIDAVTDARIGELLRLNARVRRMRDRLQQENYSVETKELWPYALERVGRFPTLVHRFVRRGNLPALGEHLLVAGPARRKRGRQPTCGTER
jgi:hypothetical protein